MAWCALALLASLPLPVPADPLDSVSLFPSSHPGKGTLARLESSAEEKLAREKKLAAAVKTVLECIGEDPERDGLIKTPERYAKALLWMTKGYEERLPGVSRLGAAAGYAGKQRLTRGRAYDRRDRQRHLCRGPRGDGDCARHRHLFALRAPHGALPRQGAPASSFVDGLCDLDALTPRGTPLRSRLATSPTSLSWACPSWHASPRRSRDDCRCRSA